MKIALVHDYIKEYGGAEKVLETLHELYPDATVFTSVYLPSYLGPHRERFADWKIKTSWLQYLPFKAKLISPIRLIAPFVFKQFDLSGYDLIIVSATGAYSPNGIRKGKGVQVCYCHTPPRYLYGYATAREWKNNKVLLVLGTIANHFLRLVDFNSAQNVDHFIANSEEVAGRIKKFYRKDVTVIYPPVEIPNPKSQIPNNSQNTKYIIPNTLYYLAGSRLARPKHIDLIIKTAKKYNIPLKVFGKAFAGYEDELKELAGNSKHIEFLGEVTNEEKFVLMKQAKAYINASEDEDFGITPVEAMGVGTAVIAYKSGGVKETVVDGKTGIFFDELTVESLKNALDRFEKIKIHSEDCIKRAEKFGPERFKNEIKSLVEKATSS